MLVLSPFRVASGHFGRDPILCKLRMAKDAAKILNNVHCSGHTVNAVDVDQRGDASVAQALVFDSGTNQVVISLLWLMPKLLSSMVIDHHKLANQLALRCTKRFNVATEKRTTAHRLTTAENYGLRCDELVTLPAHAG